MSSHENDYTAVVNEVGGIPNGDRAAEEATGGASIEKVRDILFGSQLREFERRFTRLEDRIVKEANDLKQALKTRVDALELFAKNETEALAEQIKAEHQDRVESHGSVTREVKEATKSLERRTTTLDEQLTKGQRELRQQILEQSQRLSEDVRKKTDEVLAALAQEAKELRSDKADRTTLAALLTEMAMRLANDVPTPDAEDAGNG